MGIKLSSPKIGLATEAVDFRKSIDGLCELIQRQFEWELKESIFIFLNRDRKKVKLFMWHKNGFVLIYKHIAICRKIPVMEIEEKSAVMTTILPDISMDKIGLLESMLAEKDVKILTLEKELRWLKEQCQLMRQRQFGRSTEKSNVLQEELVFDEVPEAVDYPACIN